jgi:hypothetical protein
MADMPTLSDDIDGILAGDLTIMLAQVTPMHGVVLTPVNNFGWDPETRSVTLTSDLAAYRKLERLERNPQVSLVFHVREPGRSEGDQYVLLQGRASFSWYPNRDELEQLLDHGENELGPNRLGGRFWDWWLAPFFWNRVTIRVTAERLVSFDDSACRGAATVIGTPLPNDLPARQKPPGNGIEPRVGLRRTVRQLTQMPHLLLGWAGSDGYPVVAPVRVAGATPVGIKLSVPGALRPTGQRRAGLTAHQYSDGTLGQRQAVMTGWLAAADESGELTYSPHTKLGYRLPPSRLLFRVLLGAICRIGLARARRAGVPSLAG